MEHRGIQEANLFSLFVLKIPGEDFRLRLKIRTKIKKTKGGKTCIPYIS
jgi:hypothetical protein